MFNFDKVIELIKIFEKEKIKFDVDFYRDTKRRNKIVYDFTFLFADKVEIWLTEEIMNFENNDDCVVNFNIKLINDCAEEKWSDEMINVARIFEVTCKNRKMVEIPNN